MKPERDEQSLSLMQTYEQSEYVSLGSPETTRVTGKQGLNIRPIWRLIRRNILLIGGINLLVAGFTTYLAVSRPLAYEGEFQLLVEPVTALEKLPDLSIPSQDGITPDVEVLDYSTLIRVLKSPNILDLMVSQIEPSYPISYNELTRDMRIERIGQDEFNKTKLLRVSYISSDKAKINFVLKTLADGYLRYSTEDRKNRIGGGVAFIAKQLPELRQRVSSLEGELQTLQQQERISDLDSEGAELAKQARELESQRLETQRNLRSQQKLYVNLQKQLGLNPKQVIAVSSLSEDPRYQQLLNQLRQVEAQLAQDRARFTDTNPAIQELREQQRNLQALLSQETRKLSGQSRTGAGSSANLPQFQSSIQRSLSQQMIDTLNDIQILEIRNQAATQAAATVDAKLRRFPAVKRKYEQLNRQLEIDTTTLKQLLLKREALNVEAARQQDKSWQLLTTPRIRTDDQGNEVVLEQGRPQKIALGIVGGFLLGLGVALLKERQQNTFYSIDDLQDQTPFPLLGSLPFNQAIEAIDQRPHASEFGEESVANHQNQAFLQASEALYTKIRFLAVEPPVRSIVVSSVATRDGKTTVALYLAQSAARMGQRVLLVDANIVFPQLHNRLGLPNFEGLSDILDRNLDPNQLIQRVPYQKNLSLLTAGQALTGANKATASKQMQYLMEQLHSTFDLVIYDTPYLQGHADANFLAVNADGLLMVVGMGKTQQSDFMKTMKDLQASRLPILGLVSNFSGEEPKNPEDEDYFEDNSFDEEDVEDEFNIFRISSRQS